MSTSRTHKLPDYLAPSPVSGAKSNGDSASNHGGYVIPSGHSWDDDCWELAEDLHIEVNILPEEMVAVNRLTVQEYGIGDSCESAIQDLLASLSDYYQSLESREATLAPPAIRDLELLRRLVRSKVGSQSGH